MRLQPPPEPRLRRFIRWTLVTVLAVHLPIWAASSYAAWFQVYRLELHPPAGPLSPGTPLAADVLSSGRVWVGLRMELIQDGTTHLIATHQVDDNDWAGYDQTPVPDSLRVTLPRALHARLHPGPAMLRVVATGRSQWSRTPPPEVRELVVQVSP
jgi:hypothetical protein